MEVPDILQLDKDELQLEYDEKCNEVAELRQELHAARLEAQKLQLRLRGAAKARDQAAAEAALPDGAPHRRHEAEMRSLLSWLAAHVDLESTEVLEVGFEVPIGGRKVQLRTVAQWPVGPSGRLRLSVPVVQREEVSALLLAARCRADGQVDACTCRRLATNWEFVPGELAVGPEGKAEPAVLLADRLSDEGMLVAPWPTPAALEEALTMRLEADAAAGRPKAGERVEVEFEGEWYTGVLDYVDVTGKASVQCDVDPPGVVTIAPMCSVRRPEPQEEGSVQAGAGPDSQEACARQESIGHRRTRSAM